MRGVLEPKEAEVLINDVCGTILSMEVLVEWSWWDSRGEMRLVAEFVRMLQRGCGKGTAENCYWGHRIAASLTGFYPPTVAAEVFGEMIAGR